MADKVKIDFVSDKSGIKSAIDDLTTLGKVEKKNADQFKKSNEDNLSASKKRQDAITKETLLMQDLEKAKKKAFDPDSIRAYNDDIKKAKDNIAVLKGETDKLDKSSGNFLSTLKNVGASLGIVFGTQQLISFGTEAVKLAAKGEGIRTAFSRIGNDGALEKLRVATRGAVSDIELMSKALRASDFGISTDLLAKGLEFAGKQAARTGQDVDYLVDSLVNGIGRKSTLVLDNLGISAAQLQEEVKRLGGDFNQAVGNIINKKLEDMGEVLETNATKLAKLSAGWDNFKERAGVAIIDSITLLGDLDTALERSAKSFFEFLGLDNGIHEQRQREEKERTDASKKGAEARKAAQIKSLEEEIAIFKELATDSLADKKELAILEKELAHLTGKDIIAVKKKLTEEEIEELKKLREEEAKHKQDILNKEIEDNAKAFDTLNKLRLDALKIAQEAELLQVRSGSDEEFELKKSHVIAMAEFRIATEVEHQEEEKNIRAKAENDILELTKKRIEGQRAEEKKKNEEDFKDRERIADEELKFYEDVEKEKAYLIQQVKEQAFSFVTTLNDRETQNRLDNLNYQLEAGIINQEEFDKKEREVKRKAANRDKALSLFRIAIQTAENVTKYTGGLPATAPLLALAIAVGSIQAGVVLAQPIPFAKGTKSVPGQKKGVDSVHALLMPEEMVIPVGTKKKYEPILNSIFDEKISPDFLNALAMKKDMKFDGSARLSKYDIKDGMTAALRNGVYINNMPDNDRGMTIDDFRFLTRRGLA